MTEANPADSPVTSTLPRLPGSNPKARCFRVGIKVYMEWEHSEDDEEEETTEEEEKPLVAAVQQDTIVRYHQFPGHLVCF